jgi:hypothetical protein
MKTATPGAVTGRMNDCAFNVTNNNFTTSFMSPNLQIAFEESFHGKTTNVRELSRRRAHPKEAHQHWPCLICYHICCMNRHWAFQLLLQLSTQINMVEVAMRI